VISPFFFFAFRYDKEGIQIKMKAPEVKIREVRVKSD
jgi:hypothetical protein